MKYDINFKLKCIELYNNGQWPDTPKGIGQKNFRKRIFNWVKTLELHGIEGLEHPLTCKERTAEERCVFGFSGNLLVRLQHVG